MGHRGKRKRHAGGHSRQNPHHRAKAAHFGEIQQAPMSLSDQETSKLEALFHKSFTYKNGSSESWTLPAANILFKCEPWEDAELQGLKTELNDVKNKLSELDIEKWHRHTTWTHRAGMVVSHMRRTINPELCTQAWCKFLEIVKSFRILPTELRTLGADLCSVHLCEGPGAFVTCLNHVIHSQGRIGRFKSSIQNNVTSFSKQIARIIHSCTNHDNILVLISFAYCLCI